MDIEVLQTDVLALRKLYGLLRLNDGDSPPNRLDENSRRFLKSLLDNATGKILDAQAKIVSVAQSRDIINPTVNNDEQQMPVLRNNLASMQPDVSGRPPLPCNVRPDVSKESTRSSDVLLKKDGDLSLALKPTNMVSSSDLSLSKLVMTPSNVSGIRIKRCRVCGKRKSPELFSTPTTTVIMQINGSDTDRDKLLSNKDHLNPLTHPESHRNPDYCVPQAPPLQVSETKRFPSLDNSHDVLQRKGVEQIRFTFGNNAGSVTTPGASKPPLSAGTGRNLSNNKAVAGVDTFSKEVDDAIKRLDSLIIPSLQQLVAKSVQAANNNYISSGTQEGNYYGMASLTPRANSVSPVLDSTKDKLLVARETTNRSSKSLVSSQNSLTTMANQRTGEKSDEPAAEWLRLLQGDNLNCAGYHHMQARVGSVTENQVRGEVKLWSGGAVSEKETHLLNDATSRSSKPSPFADKQFDLGTSERLGGANGLGLPDDSVIQDPKNLAPARGIQQFQRTGSGKNDKGNVDRIESLKRRATRDQKPGLRILPSQLTTEENRNPVDHITGERTMRRTKMSRPPTPSIGSTSFRRTTQKSYSHDRQWDQTNTRRASSSQGNQKRQTFRKSTRPLYNKPAATDFASSVANRNNSGTKKYVFRSPRNKQPLVSYYEDSDYVETSWDSASSSRWASQQNSTSSYTSYSETDYEPSSSWHSSESLESAELLPAPKASHQFLGHQAQLVSNGSSEYHRSNSNKDDSSVVGSSSRMDRTRSYKSELQPAPKARHQHVSLRAQLVSSRSNSSEYDRSNSYQDDSSVVGSSRRVGWTKSYESEDDQIVHEKGAGRLKNIKNKLGLILHHHHHHHHHNGDGDHEVKTGHGKSFWKRFGKMFQHTSKKTYRHDQKLPRSGKARKAIVKRGPKQKQQLGHFHALVEGLMKHVKHSKKSKLGKARRMGQLRDDRHHGGGKMVGRSLNWWQKVGGRNGVKVNNKARVKMGGRSKKPQLAAAKMILRK